MAGARQPPFGDFDVVPLRAGETLRWKLLEAGA